MNLPLTSIAKPKIGTCPHGLPQGACPICSGMGGGGGSTKKNERPAGEMTWDECVAMGQILKAQRLAQQQRNLAMQGQIAQPPVNFADKLGAMAQKMASLTEKLTNFVQKNQAPPTIAHKALALAAKIAIPVLNVLKAIPTIAQKALNFVGQKLADISDKLNAVFGELKNSIEKKISDGLKNFRKKAKSIFGIFEPTELDEEEKFEEEKKVFDLKTTFESIKGHLTKKKEETNQEFNKLAS